MMHPFGVVDTLVMMAAVAVRFDGSLKLPTKDGMCRIATAAATISFNDLENTLENELILGCKHLDMEICKTSGEVEFAALILGLEGLLEHMDEFAPPANGVIKVQGDCKTAIQQMQGRARSRKLGPFYDTACQLVEKIPYTLEFEHIPREQNVLCDGICSRLMASRQELVLELVNASLLEALGCSNSQVCRHSLRQTFQAYLFPPTVLTRRARLQAYSILGKVTWLQEDFKFLLELGQQMQDLSELTETRSLAPTTTNKDRISKEMIAYKLEGLQYEIAALRELGKEKEVTKAERREKTLRLRYGIVEESNQSDLCKDCLSTHCTSSLVPEALQWIKDCREEIRSKFSDSEARSPDDESAILNADESWSPLIESSVHQLAKRATGFISLNEAVWLRL